MTTIIIGGGASGLFAAYTSALKGNKVILIEKNEKLGKKIYITGKKTATFNVFNNDSFSLIQINSTTNSIYIKEKTAHKTLVVISL
jgi:predicted flavoprotein YhiN